MCAKHVSSNPIIKSAPVFGCLEAEAFLFHWPSVFLPLQKTLAQAETKCQRILIMSHVV